MPSSQPDVAEILFDHFSNIHTKANRGLVTLITTNNLWPADPSHPPTPAERWRGLFAGIGNHPFLRIKFLDTSINISACLPIKSTAPEDFANTRKAFCITLPKHYNKLSVRQNELISGLSNNFANRHLPTKGQSWSNITIDTNYPHSILMAEFYVGKILGAIRRKVKIHKGWGNFADAAFLKDVTDITNLIDFATGEWEKFQSKQRRKRR